MVKGVQLVEVYMGRVLFPFLFVLVCLCMSVCTIRCSVWCGCDQLSHGVYGCGCDQLSHGVYGVGVTSYHMVYMVWV